MIAGIMTTLKNGILKELYIASRMQRIWRNRRRYIAEVDDVQGKDHHTMKLRKPGNLNV
jgi:hypothetical protein